PVLEQMKGLSGAEYALDAAGRLTATLPESLIVLPPPDPTADAPESMLGERVVIGGQPYLHRGITLRPPHPNAGGVLHVFYPEQLLKDELRAAAWPLLGLGVTCGLVAVGLAVGIGHRLVGRIREFQRQTRRIADGDFRPMPLAERDDELRDLG